MGRIVKWFLCFSLLSIMVIILIPDDGTCASEEIKLIIDGENEPVIDKSYGYSVSAEVGGPSVEKEYEIDECKWDWGDGTTGEGVEASHAWKSLGGKVIKAMATLTNGKQVVGYANITVVGAATTPTPKKTVPTPTPKKTTPTPAIPGAPSVSISCDIENPDGVHMGKVVVITVTSENVPKNMGEDNGYGETWSVIVEGTQTQAEGERTYTMGGKDVDITLKISYSCGASSEEATSNTITLTYVEEKQYFHVVITGDEEGGWYSPHYDEEEVKKGTVIKVQANSDKGYYFAGWVVEEGSIPAPSTSDDIEVGGAFKIYAKFKPVGGP